MEIKHSIFCLSENHEFNIEIDSLNDKNIKKIIGDIFQDEIYNALSSYNKPIGFFPDPNKLNGDLYLHAQDYIKKELADIHVFLRELNDSNLNCIISEKPLDIIQILSAILEERQGCEQNYIDTGEAALRCLETFLKQAYWHFGLQTSEGCINCDLSLWPCPVNLEGSIVWNDTNDFLTPIIWFGIKGKAPDECWIISKNTNGLMALGGGWTFNWNVLFNGNGFWHIIWMLDECGMDEPSTENLIVNCPIKINDEGCSETLRKDIDDYFIGLWEKAKK